MMSTARRPTSRIDVCNYNSLLYRDYDSNINPRKNYLLSPSPPPMTYRDLRSVMSNIRSSNVVIVPISLNSPQTLTNNSPVPNRRKHTSRKRHKHQPVDVYRTLVRAESRSSALPERDITNDEMMLLANSFITDHIPPLPTSGFFHPQNLPNVQRNRNNNNNNRTEHIRAKSSYSPSPSLRIQHVGHMRPTPVGLQYEDNNNNNRLLTSYIKVRYSSSPSLRTQPARNIQPTPPQLIHRTTPVDIQYEENNSHTLITTTTTTTTMNSSSIPETQARKQLHVYMPQILSC